MITGFLESGIKIGTGESWEQARFALSPAPCTRGLGIGTRDSSVFENGGKGEATTEGSRNFS